MSKVFDALEEEISSIMEAMKDLEPDSDEYAKMAENLKVLNELRLKEVELEGKFAADYERMEAYEKDRKERKLFKVIDVVSGAVLTILPIAVYRNVMKEGYHFEQEGNLVCKTFAEARSRFAQMIFK